MPFVWCFVALWVDGGVSLDIHTILSLTNLVAIIVIALKFNSKFSIILYQHSFLWDDFLKRKGISEKDLPKSFSMEA